MLAIMDSLSAGIHIDARYKGNARDDEDEDEDEDDDVKKGQTLLMRASVLNLTGPPGDRGALQCHWRAIATQPIGLVPFQECGILSVVEEQGRTCGGKSGGVDDQPQY